DLCDVRPSGAVSPRAAASRPGVVRPGRRSARASRPRWQRVLDRPALRARPPPLGADRPLAFGPSADGERGRQRLRRLQRRDLQLPGPHDPAEAPRPPLPWYLRHRGAGSLVRGIRRADGLPPAWDLRVRGLRHSAATHVPRPRPLLEAVAAQSVADVPVAALLSGGIDSSLVVAAHSRITGQRTTTFNVHFPDRAHDETVPALAVSGHYGTQHHTIELSDQALTP